MKANASDKRPGGLPDLLRQHLALALTGLVFITVGLRVLAATRGNVSAALALLQNADPVEVFVGMGIQLLPLLPLVIVSIVVFMRERTALAGSAIERQRAVGFTYRAIGAAMIVSSLLAPYHWGYLVALGAGVIVTGLGWAIARDVMPSRLRDRLAGRVTRERWERTLRRSRVGVVFFTGVIYLLLVLTPTMWLPRETIDHGKSETVGFVLKSDFVETVVVVSRTRGVVHILTRDLDGRHICVLRKQERPLLFRLMGGDQPSYPRCPSEGA